MQIRGDDGVAARGETLRQLQAETRAAPVISSARGS